MPASDVTLFGYNISVHWCLQAAETAARKDGIDAEVVDLYALSPLDRAGIARSVSKTHRAVVVEEAEPPVGVGAEVMAIINEECFFDLDAAPVRVSAANVPDAVQPSPGKGRDSECQRRGDAVRRMFGK